MTNKNRTKVPTYSEPTTSNKEGGTLKLSSKSHANEQENVSKYMKYPNGYFAYLRIGKTGSPIRFYPDAQTAYTATLNEYDSLLSQGVSGSRTSLSISDMNGSIVYEGVPKMNGKIRFSIYEGKDVSKTVSITDFKNTYSFTTNNTDMKQTKEKFSNYEEGALAGNIKSNASTFIDNNILTQENVNFLCLSNTSARKMAKVIQETAINNKDADNDTFTRAIQDVSLNMITITKKLASGNPTDDKHCSMHDDLLYCAAHCKSSDYLFNGSNKWRKTPGKLNYNKLENAIMDMYNRGQEMILSASNTDQPKVSIAKSQVHNDTPVIEEAPTLTNGHRTFTEVVQAMTSTIMTYTTTSEDIRFYLKMKCCSLESEIKSLTNSVVTTTLSDNKITFVLPSGISKELRISDYTDNIALRNSVCSITKQLLICAALSNKTRESIANAVSLDTIEDYVNSLPNLAA